MPLIHGGCAVPLSAPYARPKKRYDELMAQEERERQQIRKLVDELDIEEPDEARP
jgi:hypothetical protein